MISCPLESATNSIERLIEISGLRPGKKLYELLTVPSCRRRTRES
jgi:FlaA1/EpsC-like NDP-sugar epimerase